MLVADKSIRSLKNPETGLDISVPSVHEVEAPLGGKSVEYAISVVTNLPAFKSHLYKEEDIVCYSIQRAYREIEDFHEKVEKKFKDVSVPSIPKGRDVLKFSSEEKRAVLDTFLQNISRHKIICQSILFSNFVGINKLKSQTTASFPKEKALHRDESNCNEDAQSQSSANDSPTNAANNVSENVVDPTISKLFPKVKMRKSSKPEAGISSENCFDADSALFSEGKTYKSVEDDDDLDLFEEAKKIPKDVGKQESVFESDRKSKNNQFDSFYEDGNLFSNIFAKKEVIANKSKDAQTDEEFYERRRRRIDRNGTKPQDEKGLDSSHEESSSAKEQASKMTRDVSNSESIKKIDLSNEVDASEEKKIVGVSLFEEQDFGAAITEDDETLFFVEKQLEKTTVNPFLSPTGDGNEDSGVAESLEDLMSIQQPSITPEKPQKTSEVDRGVVRPSKPPVPERKPTQTKPQIAPKKVPSVPQKPILPPKPKVMKKPAVEGDNESKKPAAVVDDQKKEDDSSVNKSPSNAESNQSSKLFDDNDLTSFDIMKYIEQEEKVASAGASLFD